MKKLIILLTILTIGVIAKAQYGESYIDILILKKERQAKHFHWRLDKAVIGNAYFECDSLSYCYELYENDKEEYFKYLGFKWNLIPKRWYKKIERIEFITTESGDFLETESGDKIY
jgi:hypothetical protein